MNLSTSSIIKNIAKKFNKNVFYTPVGEINVTTLMLEKGLEIGGEGNGGIIYFPVSNSRDTLVGVTMILSLLAEDQDSIERIYDEYKSINMIKEKIKIEKSLVLDEKILFYKKLEKELIKKMEEQNYKVEYVSRQDGVRVDFENGFTHIRFSNTEPILRVIIEADNKINLNDLFGLIKKVTLNILESI